MTVIGPVSTSRRKAGVLTCLLLTWLAAVLAAQLIAAAPAAAHAELEASSPANGERLATPPQEVTLEFTDVVGLPAGGLRLLDADGDPVATPRPAAHGDTVHWPMPTDLPDGSYLVSWRVVSDDGHPVSGAFAFGVGVAPATVNPTVATTPVSWPVTTARLGGYVGFTLVVGVVALTLVCWPSGRGHRRTQALLRIGLLVAAASTVLGLLLQGPYAAGKPFSQAFDRSILNDVFRSSFGAWSQLRLYLYLFMAAVLWPKGSLQSRFSRWVAGIGLLAASVTYAGTGHAAASGRIADRVVDSAHLLAAGVWVGGLIALVVSATSRSERPTLEAFTAFSRIGLLSVLVLVGTGIVNALLHLDTLGQLWQTTYGQLLSLKVALFLVALITAAVSRRRLRNRLEPWSTVRFEAVVTLAVVVVTSVLASSPPPSTLADRPASAERQGVAEATVVEMSLGSGRTARLHVDWVGADRSSLHLELLDRSGELLVARSVKLQASLASEDLGPIDVPLAEHAGAWQGDFSFPLRGTWKMTLTVEDPRLAGLVTAGELEVP